MSQATSQSLSKGFQPLEPLAPHEFWCQPCISRLGRADDVMLTEQRHDHEMDIHDVAPLKDQQAALDLLLCKPQTCQNATTCHGCVSGQSKCEKVPFEFTNRMGTLVGLILQHQKLKVRNESEREEGERHGQILRWQMRALAIHMDREMTCFPKQAPNLADIVVYRAQKLKVLHSIKDEVVRLTTAYAALVRIFYAFFAVALLSIFLEPN
ncbi:hypothetical protein EV356DRAFT_113416 [Viridothelium virens]|uniref:Uncharacterized protein n=1 Tax=Viridothelium virens TaxID=1048519 RepID=A0A6A6HBV3_VIRVR|nr:hypothetical protein EV356DRAFT_113416 [Viridothelium virens]